MNDLLIQISMGFFAFILTIITGLMAYMTRAVVDASKKIGILENALEAAEDILKSMALDLKVIARHDSLIAVLQTEMTNVKAEISLIFERIREIGNGR